MSALRRALLVASLTPLLVAASSRESLAKPRPRKKPPPATAPASPDGNPTARPAASATPTVGADGRVDVTVIEIAGSRAYVQPGAKAGVRRGSTLVIHGRSYPVVDSSDSFAVVDVGQEPLREQEKGKSTIAPPEAETAVQLPKPQPLAKWEHAWKPEAAPADAQTPAFVPLGSDQRSSKYDVRFDVSGGALVPLQNQTGYPIYSGSLNARVHAEPFSAPVKLDFNGSLQGWAASDLASRVGGTTRSTVFVRELLVSYTPSGFYAGFGRMPYAASTVGSLDGLRLQTSLGDGFSLGAFGGFLPNPLSGSPTFDAERFGVEGRFSRQDLPLRPEASLVMQGSVYQQSLDERRLSGTFSIFPGFSRIGGYFELSNFDSNNPWGQSTFALTAAGVDQSLHFGGLSLDARFDLRQPELSRWLSSYLPVSWFCVTVPSTKPGTTLQEPCDGNISTRASGELDVGFSADRFSVSVGAMTVKDIEEPDAADMVGAFATARVVRIGQLLRVEGSANVSTGTYLDMYGGTIGPGLTFLDDTVDVSTYYRLSVLQYRADDTSLAQNGFGGILTLFPSSTVFLTFQGEAILGDDASVLSLFATATWHPHL